jgi:hypothetical protein
MEGSKTSWFPKAAGLSKILPAGMYRAHLKSITPGVGKGYEQEEPRATIMFSFQELSQSAIINRTVTATTSDKSQCVNLVRAMAGGKLTPEIIANPKAFQSFIEGFKGKLFLIQVEPSKDGRYNNLINCFAQDEIYANPVN